MSPREEAQRWLENQEPVATLSGSQTDAVKGLIGHEGFGLLLQLLGAERQGSYVLLSKLNLANEDQLRLATVTQGKIEGIERIREAVLELFPQTDPTDKEATS